MVVLSKKIKSQFDILFSSATAKVLFFLGGPKETSPPYSQGSIFSSSRSRQQYYSLYLPVKKCN